MIKKLIDDLSRGKDGYCETAYDDNIDPNNYLAAELRESEEKYQRFFSTVSNGWAYHKIILDEESKPVDYIFLEVNSGFERMTGLKAESIIGKRVTEALPGVENDSIDWIGVYGKVALTGESISFESYSEALDKWFTISASSPEKGYFITVFDDITKHKKIEIELRRFKFISDNANDANYLVDGEGQFIYVNKRACELLGYSEEELLRLGVPEVDGLYDKEAYQASFDKAQQEKIPVFETINIRKDGSSFHSELGVIGVKFDDVPYLFAVARDITERKKAEKELRDSEERLKLALMSANQGLYDLNLKTGEAVVNDEYALMLGYDPSEFTETNQKWLKRLHPDDRERISNYYFAYIRGELKTYKVEFRQKTKAGSWKWILSLGKIVEWDDDGKPLRMLGTHTDLTERIQAEADALKARNLESLGILAGGIAHDFNNLLTVIFGNIEMAKLNSPADEDAFHCLENALNASERAKRLTLQLLTFSKGGNPRKKSHSIKELIKDCCEFLLSGSTIKYEYVFPEKPCLVELDKGQMEQVFQNLFLNAKEAMPQGGKILIRVRNILLAANNDILLAEGWYVVVSVSDEGIGMDEELASRIFDPYFTTKSMGANKGSGLGLSVCRSIVIKHGGCLTVESEKGNGSTFHIYLPAAADCVEDAKSADSKTAIMKKGKILILEDEESIIPLLEQMLEHIGYESRVARKGGEAVDLYRKAQLSGELFDAALLDMTIRGGFGGMDAMRELQKLDPKVKAVLVSGYTQDEVMARPELYGFACSLRKPYNIDALRKAIDLALGKPSARSQ